MKPCAHERWYLSSFLIFIHHLVPESIWLGRRSARRIIQLVFNIGPVDCRRGEWGGGGQKEHISLKWNLFFRSSKGTSTVFTPLQSLLNWQFPGARSLGLKFAWVYQVRQGTWGDCHSDYLVFHELPQPVAIWKLRCFGTVLRTVITQDHHWRHFWDVWVLYFASIVWANTSKV